MGIKAGENAVDSQRAEVGEIDTRAPFQSVKDAVSLFGEGVFSGEKPVVRKSKTASTERVLAKETQLHLATEELNKSKDRLKNAETTKAQALAEHEKIKITVEDLTLKLKIVSESKESAIKARETAKNQAQKIEEANSGQPAGAADIWKQELHNAQEQYTVTSVELDAAKQELRKIRQDFDASMKAKISALQEVAEAENTAKANTERAAELSKEIVAVHDSLDLVKLATLQAQQGQEKVLAEKDIDRQFYRASLDEVEKKLESLKKEFDPEVTRNLELKMAETATEIGILQKELENARASDLDSLKTVTSELDDAREALQKVTEEGHSLRSLVDSLKKDLENVKKEHSEFKEKESETESIAGDLHIRLHKSKIELESAVAAESNVKAACDELAETLRQLLLESENARRDDENMKKTAEELKQEAEANRIALEEAEKKLEAALKEAEEAKAAEEKALDQVKLLTERTTAARASTSDSGGKITISTEEFESLSRKVEESEKLAEIKVAAARAQEEAVKTSESGTLTRLEASQKEIEKMKAATEEALKRADMAEAAKKAVEGELRRWREREQKRVSETASRILEEKEMSSETYPQNYRLQKQKPPEVVGIRKMEKEKTPGMKKALLPNFSGIFHRKKNQIEGGSPYIPRKL